MAFEKDGWTLFTKEVTLKGGRKQNIYFFSKKFPKDGTPCDMPEGKEIKICSTGMPVLKNK